MMGRTKGAPRNSSTVVFQHKFPFPEGRGLVGKAFCFPEIIQGLEIHEEQGWDAKPVAVSVLGSQEELEKHWESRKGAVLGQQESRMGGSGGISVLIIPQPTPAPAWLWEHARTGKGGEVFLPKFPQKRQNPSCMTHVGQRHLLFIIYPIITFSKILTDSSTGQGQSQSVPLPNRPTDPSSQLLSPVNVVFL